MYSTGIFLMWQDAIKFGASIPPIAEKSIRLIDETIVLLVTIRSELSSTPELTNNLEYTIIQFIKAFLLVMNHERQVWIKLLQKAQGQKYSYFQYKRDIKILNENTQDLYLLSMGLADITEKYKNK